MKDEKARMEEYLKKYTNANSEVLKSKSVKTAIKILEFIAFCIALVVILIWVCAFIGYAWPRIAIFFT